MTKRFSRRHSTPAEHTAAVERYRREHGRAARQRKAGERIAAARAARESAT